MSGVQEKGKLLTMHLRVLQYHVIQTTHYVIVSCQEIQVPMLTKGTAKKVSSIIVTVVILHRACHV